MSLPPLPYVDYGLPAPNSLLPLWRRVYAQTFPDGVNVEAMAVRDHPTVYNLTFKNFGSDVVERVEIHTLSCGIMTKKEVEIAENTTLVVEPSIPDIEGGLTHVTIRRSSGSLVTLYLPWRL